MQGARGCIDGAGQRRPIYVVVQNVPAIFQFIVNGNRLSQEPDLRSLFLTACEGIQFPTDHFNDPFLVSDSREGS